MNSELKMIEYVVESKWYISFFRVIVELNVKVIWVGWICIYFIFDYLVFFVWIVVLYFMYLVDVDSNSNVTDLVGFVNLIEFEVIMR